MPTPIITEEQERAMSASLHDDLNKLGQTMLRIRDERDRAVVAVKRIIEAYEQRESSGSDNYVLSVIVNIARDAIHELGSR